MTGVTTRSQPSILVTVTGNGHTRIDLNRATSAFCFGKSFLFTASFPTHAYRTKCSPLWQWPDLASIRSPHISIVALRLNCIYSRCANCQTSFVEQSTGLEKTRKRLITENYYDQRKLLRITKTLTTIGFQVSIFRANNPSDVYSQVFVYYTGILLT